MDGHTPTVLTVEDDTGLRDLYEAWLSRDYRVLTARDGKEGLERLGADVEVVVLDREMPRVNGEEFLRACRREGWDCRVVLVTGIEPDGDVLDLGFDAYLNKPVDRETLTEYVSMLLRRQRYGDDVKEYLALASKTELVEVGSLDDEHRETLRRLLDRQENLRREIDRNPEGCREDANRVEFRELIAPGAAD